ncbi:MAG: hypothetical protein JO197_06480 [Acidobacteria bacterium]|nr:hypothetical protein [Acidobacteriota bacterium]MBV9477500.1 hypothetical protein [Acidobacteriota bacterium]
MNGFDHEYGLYGLTLRSNRALPGLAPRRGDAPEIVIDFAGRTSDAFQCADEPFWQNGFETLWHRDDGSWLLRYVDERDGGFWSVAFANDATRLTVRWTDDAMLDDIPSVLQGPGLAAALHLRRVPLLHASVLATDGGAIALMGTPGAGKSTTAAAFVARGHALLSDDLAALAIDDDGIRVQPGYPRLRLYADSARAAGFAADTLPRVFAAAILGDKRFVALSPDDGTFCPEPRALRAIYLLQPRRAGGGEPRIRAVPPRNALPLLLQNIYSGRFLDASRRAMTMRACARVADAVPMYTVEAGDDLAQLPRLVDALAA